MFEWKKHKTTERIFCLRKLVTNVQRIITRETRNCCANANASQIAPVDVRSISIVKNINCY